MPDAYEFAEPANDCFIPRHGDFARSMALLKAAAAWYNGAKVTPADRKPEARVNITPSSEIMAAIARMAREYKRRGNPGLTGEDHA